MHIRDASLCHCFIFPPGTIKLLGQHCRQRGATLQVEYDPNHWIDKTAALLSGASLVVAAAAFWPCVRALDPGKGTSVSGLTVGVLVAVGVAATQQLLCLAGGICL